MWGNLNLDGSYSRVPEGVFINAPSPFIATSNIPVLHVLNSKLADYYIRSLGVTRNGGYFEYKPMFVGKCPIPQTGLDELNKYPEKPTIEQEQEINKYLFKLVGLTHEEIEFIETQ